MYKYKEMTRWQREAQGITKWDQSHSHRPLPYVERFNPEGVGLTRGTSSFAWKWWHTQYPWLPNVPPEDYITPTPLGIRPPSWDDEFAAVLLEMSDEEVKRYLKEKLSDVIFEETQRDGYELRRLDFEGKPVTAKPEPHIIEQFVLEEETLRERVLHEVVENMFRLCPTSEDRKELKTVQAIVHFVMTHVTFARPKPVHHITAAAKEVMQSFPLQPELGYEHALPTDNRDALLKEWERSHHADWQFGKAIFEPRSTENKRGNLTWLREVRHYEARMEFQREVESGEAKQRHMEKIRAAEEKLAESASSYVGN